MARHDRSERYFADDAGQMVESARWRWLVGIRYGVHRKILGRNVAFTLMMLGTHMSAEGGRCWPSQALLAEESNANRRTIRRHLEQAAAEGWIFRVRRAGAGQAWAQYSYQATLPVAVDDALDDYLKGRPEAEEGGDNKPQPSLAESSPSDTHGRVAVVAAHRAPEGGDISDEGGDIFDKGWVPPRQKDGTQLGPMRCSRDIHSDVQEREGCTAAPSNGSPVARIDLASRIRRLRDVMPDADQHELARVAHVSVDEVIDALEQTA
jgi:DNA-binding transcriptional MocR family regulator